MSVTPSLSAAEAVQTHKRRVDAMASQAIEHNPLTADEIAMFEMFERERWPHDRRRAYLHSLGQAIAAE